MFGTKRLKKKSQSVDVTAPGHNLPAPEAQEIPQASKLIPVIKTAAFEEEQNTTNTQRRNPRRSELRRYYTIGKSQQSRNSEFQPSLALIKRNEDWAANHSMIIVKMMTVIWLQGETTQDQTYFKEIMRYACINKLDNKK